MTQVAKGTFVVKMEGLTFEGQPDGSLLGRMSIDRSRSPAISSPRRGPDAERDDGHQGIGGLRGRRVQLTARCTGRTGTFVLQHSGSMHRGVPSLSVTVVPDSGTGELTGLAGEFTIAVAGGVRSYEFRYTLP
ncbi:MAG: DUF3224 domain-containing protein [Vicinamibacterales bacterium]